MIELVAEELELKELKLGNPEIFMRYLLVSPDPACHLVPVLLPGRLEVGGVGFNESVPGPGKPFLIFTLYRFETARAATGHG
jgi:hypothetical protein